MGDGSRIVHESRVFSESPRSHKTQTRSATFTLGANRMTQPTKGAGTLRRAVRSQAFDRIPGGRHMECAYYFWEGTWNVPITLTFVGCDFIWTNPKSLFQSVRFAWR
jgi:hypothetical protein